SVQSLAELGHHSHRGVVRISKRRGLNKQQKRCPPRSFTADRAIGSDVENCSFIVQGKDVHFADRGRYSLPRPLTFSLLICLSRADMRDTCDYFAKELSPAAIPATSRKCGSSGQLDPPVRLLLMNRTTASDQPGMERRERG